MDIGRTNYRSFEEDLHMEPKVNSVPKEKMLEMKQAFLSSAISDISSYIQLSDTKVSIIMAAMVH